MANKGSKGISVEYVNNFGLVKEVAEKAAMKGLKLLAENILGESQKLVPVDTGILQKSGTMTTDKANKTVTISYNTPYALKQHEDGSLKHPRGGEAKYLERPFNEKAGQAENFIGNELYKAMTKGVKD